MRERKAYEPSLFSNSKYLIQSIILFLPLFIYFFPFLTGGGNGGRTKILRLGSKVIIVI
jgi:hypothetical protein